MSDAAAKSKVAEASKAQSEMAAAAKTVRTLAGGTVAMRKAGTDYLPQEAAESKAAYDARLARSVLFNALEKTVDDLTGKVFSKPVTLAEDVAPQIVKWAENIDNAGRHLNVFARDVFKDALHPGIGFILADMPPAVTREDGKPATIEDEAKAGIRPYLVYIPLERVLGWKSQTIGGVETLTQFRFMECVTEPDGEFHEAEVEQVRVIEPGLWRTFRKGDKDWIEHARGTISVKDKICVAPVYLNRTAFMAGSPPLQKLADLNITHWQSDSDQRNILHVARVPILFMAGFDDEADIEIGASKAVRTSNATAKMEFVEHSGQAIGAGQVDLEKLEFRMQTMGLQLLVDKPGQTATGEVRDDVKENSTLAMMAAALQDALEQSFGFMAQFAGLGEVKGGSIVVNKDFGIQLGAATLTDLISMVNSLAISKETFWLELQRRGVLSDSFDPEVEKDRVASEAPVLDAGTGKGMKLGAE